MPNIEFFTLLFMMHIHHIYTNSNTDYTWTFYIALTRSNTVILRNHVKYEKPENEEGAIGMHVSDERTIYKRFTII